MSERGVFAIDRGLFEHPAFKTEPYTEREAWMWMLGQASYKARTVRVGSLIVPLCRGQLAHSLRFMAEKWGWSEPRVRRFIGRLKYSISCARNNENIPSETDALISVSNKHGVTVITIRKYDKYQKVALPDDAVTDAPNDAGATQERRKEEGKERKEEDSVANATGTDVPPVYTDSKHELWGEGVPILISLGVNERTARSNIGRWLRDAKDDAQRVLGAIQRARDARVIEPIAWITRSISTGTRTTDGTPRKNSFQGALARLGELADELERGDGAAPEGGQAPSRLLSHG